jgi:hypothetical protein
MKKFNFSSYIIGVTIGILITIAPSYNTGHLKGYAKGLADGRKLWEKQPQEIKLMCLDNEKKVWDRCRQKDGKFLTASGTEAEQIQFYFDYIQKEIKNGR